MPEPRHVIAFFFFTTGIATILCIGTTLDPIAVCTVLDILAIPGFAIYTIRRHLQIGQSVCSGKCALELLGWYLFLFAFMEAHTMIARMHPEFEAYKERSESVWRHGVLAGREAVAREHDLRVAEKARWREHAQSAQRQVYENAELQKQMDYTIHKKAHLVPTMRPQVEDDKHDHDVPGSKRKMSKEATAEIINMIETSIRSTPISHRHHHDPNQTRTDM